MPGDSTCVVLRGPGGEDVPDYVRHIGTSVGTIHKTLSSCCTRLGGLSSASGWLMHRVRGRDPSTGQQRETLLRLARPAESGPGVAGYSPARLRMFYDFWQELVALTDADDCPPCVRALVDQCPEPVGAPRECSLPVSMAVERAAFSLIKSIRQVATRTPDALMRHRARVSSRQERNSERRRKRGRHARGTRPAPDAIAASFFDEISVHLSGSILWHCKTHGGHGIETWIPSAIASQQLGLGELNRAVHVSLRHFIENVKSLSNVE